MQLLRYQAGEKYNPHFDSFGKDLLEKNKINQRLTTFILYLSDDYEGGETYFPLREVEIKPRIGSLLIFNNCFHGTNFTHPKSLHGSKSIKAGTKWAINFWSSEEVSIDKIL
jgi:prolyl 4-hydroxylase